MATYCGKNCDDCTYRKSPFFFCAACESGPENTINGDCKLACCCREKGHKTCETCGFKSNCDIWLNKENIPKQRMENYIRKIERQEVLKRRAPFMARWLTVLLWLMLLRFIGSFLANAVDTIPNVQWIGGMLKQLCLLVQAVIFLHMSKENKLYKAAGVLGLTDVALYVVVTGFGLVNFGFGRFLGILELLIVLFSKKYEYQAHAELILPIDQKLSEQWDMVWKWRMYSTIAVYFATRLMKTIPLLGFLLFLAAAIGMAVSIVKNVICLRRTIKAFRKISKEKK